MFIITTTSPDTGSTFARTKDGNWCFRYAGVNEYLWATFETKAAADAEIEKVWDTVPWHVDVEEFQ
jgi:hypothetical protein